MLSRIFLCSVLFGLAASGPPCFAQQNRKLADSLAALLERPDDSIKVDILNRYVTQIRDGDNITAMKWAVKAREITEKLGYKRGLAGALANIGWIYYRQGDFPAALENTTRSLAISESLRDYKEMGSGTNNLASVYVEQKEYSEALTTFKKALTWGRKSKDEFTIGRSYNNIAYVFFLMNALDSAKYYAEAGISATHGHSAGFAWRTLGDVYEEQNKPELAEKNYLKSISVADSNKNFSLKVSTGHRLGKLYFSLGQTEKALKVLKENEELCKKFNFRSELANTYKILASLYKKILDFNNASSYLGKYKSLNDSLYNESRNKQIALLENKYNNVKIDLLTKEGELKDNEIKSQRLKSFVSIGGLLSFVVFAFLLYVSNKRIRLVNEQLELKNKEILDRGEELKSQAEALAQLNTTKDKLFSIISHDLRGPLNSLSGLLQLIEKGYLNEKEFKNYVVELAKNTNRTKELLNNLLYWSSTQLKKENPNPQKFNVKDLVDSVIMLYEKQADEKEIRVMNLMSDLSVWADPDMVSLVLRNLISNALKFSGSGGSITIGNEVESHQVKCFVKDDGVGISKMTLSQLFSGEMVSTKGTANEGGTGLGIQLCIDFIQKNGGRLWADSTENSGSTFWFTLPLPV